MRAIISTSPRAPLEFAEIEIPKLKSQQVLIEVKAFGINYPDLLQRKGKYPPPPGSSEILGLEVAGIIKECATEAKRFKPGDKVMALLSGGGYAEFALADEALTMPIPDSLSFIESAAIPESFLTAYQALFFIGETLPTQWVLIHAGGSGVGTAALQLARTIGARTIATSLSQEKLEKCLSLGADAVLNPLPDGFAKKVLEITENHGVDLVLDFIGADYFTENMKALASGGTIIFLGTLGGHSISNLDIRSLLCKWATLTATTLRSRPLQYKAKLIEEFTHFSMDRFSKKTLRPILHASFPWTQISKAHQLLSEHKIFGKIVLTID